MKRLQQFIGVFISIISVNETKFNSVILFILNLVLSMPHKNMVIVMKLHSIYPLGISNQAQ